MIFVPPGIGPLPRCFASTLQNFQVFACILTVSQRPHVICNSYTLLRPHLWEYPFTPYLYSDRPFDAEADLPWPPVE